MENNYNQQQIEAYLLGDLKAEDKVVFEQRLAEDDNLKSEVADYQKMIDFVEKKGKEEMNNLIQLTDSQLFEEGFFNKKEEAKVVKMQPRFRLMAMAASVVILLGIGAWWWSQKNYSNAALAAEYELEFTSKGLKGGDNLTEKDAFLEGLAAFEKDEFEAAISAFKKVENSAPNFMEAQFYLGQIFTQNGNFEKAENLLKNVANSGDVRFAEKAEWQLILTKMQAQKPTTEILKNLQLIIENSDHSFHQNAKELKGKLERFWRKLAN